MLTDAVTYYDDHVGLGTADDVGEFRHGWFADGDDDTCGTTGC
jgi:hypothetical protein